MSPVRSGVVNTGGPFDLRATAAAADSTYAGIVRLVSEAEATLAPFVRLADRYAVWFLLVSLAAAGLHAILRLHTAQEDESYLSFGDTGPAPGGRSAMAV